MPTLGSVHTNKPAVISDTPPLCREFRITYSGPPEQIWLSVFRTYSCAPSFSPHCSPRNGFLFASNNLLLNLSWGLTLFPLFPLQRTPAMGSRPTAKAGWAACSTSLSFRTQTWWKSSSEQRVASLGCHGHTSRPEDVVGVPTLQTNWENLKKDGESLCLKWSLGLLRWDLGLGEK